MGVVEDNAKKKKKGNVLRVKGYEVLLFLIALCFPLDDVCYIHN